MRQSGRQLSEAPITLICRRMGQDVARTHQTVTISIRVAWWLRWYLAGVALMCELTGCQPDYDRVRCWVLRAIRLRVEG